MLNHICCVLDMTVSTVCLCDAIFALEAKLGLRHQWSWGTILIFWIHFRQSLADVEQMGCIKKQVQSLSYSSEFAQEQLQFPKAFWQKKNAEVSLFLHSPPQCCRSMQSTLLCFLTEVWTQAECFGLLLPLTPTWCCGLRSSNRDVYTYSTLFAKLYNTSFFFFLIIPFCFFEMVPKQQHFRGKLPPSHFQKFKVILLMITVHNCGFRPVVTYTLILDHSKLINCNQYL